MFKELYEEILAYCKERGTSLVQCNDHMSIKVQGMDGRYWCVAEIHEQKSCVKFNFNSKSLTPGMESLCNVTKFGWTVDAIFKATTREELELAKGMIDAGIKFRKKI